MYILIREEGDRKQVINILFGDDIASVRKWVEDYLLTEVTSYSYMPLQKYTKNVSYSFGCDGGDFFRFIKSYKRISKGYVYNSSDKVEEVMFTIKCLEYQSRNSITHVGSGTLLWTDINAEINNRVLKQLDKDSLFQVVSEVHNRIPLKGTWDNSEYSRMFSEVLKNFKKDSYSTVVRKLKRYGFKSS